MGKSREEWVNDGRARARARARLAAEGLPCHLCGAPIDYTLPRGHPWSFELDHVVPVSRGGDPWARENWAPAHRICNERKGNRVPSDGVTPQIVRTRLF